MPAPVLLHALALLLIAALPGWLLWSAWLKDIGLSWRVSTALVLAAQTMLFVNLGVLAGYSLPLMGTIVLAVVLGALAIWLVRGRPSLALPPPNWNDLAFFGLLCAVYLAPAFVLYLPLDTDGQGFGHIALMIREGGTLHTMAPWMPDVRYLYSPGAFVWWAFFSDLFGLPLHQVMLPFSHLLAALTILLSIDLGEELLPESPGSRWVFPLMMTLGTGMFLRVMDSAYTSVTATLFVVLFLTIGLRTLRDARPALTGLAALALACVTLTHPDTIIILLLAYIPFYATFWLATDDRRTRANWLRFFVIVPAVGVAFCLPWALRVLPLFFEETVRSPFPLSPTHVLNLIVYQGVIVALIALPGVIRAIGRRNLTDILMLTWLVFIVDFSLFGVVERIVLVTGFDVMRYAYPHSIAWAGPPIPYAYFATLAAAPLLTRIPARVIGIGSAVGIVAAVSAVIAAVPVLNATQPYLSFFGTFSSRADVAAMAYLREETPPDALILNYPLGFEGHWVPSIAERNAIEFRDQPFFAGADPYYDRMADFEAVYFDLADPEARALIEERGITHVIVPQLVTNPDLFGDMRQTIRWRWPDDAWYAFPPAPDYLELVFDMDGARVYRVTDD